MFEANANMHPHYKNINLSKASQEQPIPAAEKYVGMHFVIDSGAKYINSAIQSLSRFVSGRG